MPLKLDIELAQEISLNPVMITTYSTHLPADILQLQYSSGWDNAP